MQKILSGWHLFILALMTSFAAVLAVLFSPALPEIARYFKISEGQSQMTLTLYLLGYACGMLIYGPLANRYGRKSALLTGLTIALIAALLSLWVGEAHLFWLFCFLRFVQALGASCGLKIAMTMIADVLTGKKAIRAISLVVLSFVLAPAVGVAIGGGLVDSFGWKGCFIFMALYNAFLIVLGFQLFETAPQLDLGALRVSHIAHALGKEFQDRFLILHGLLMGLVVSFFYLFAALGPYLGIEKMGLAPTQYGLLAMIPPCGFGIGSILNARCAGKQSPHQFIIYGILCSLIGVTAMLIAFLNHSLNLWSLFVLMGVIEVGSALIYPNASMLALDRATDKASASATLQFVSMGTAFIVTSIASVIPVYQPTLLPLLLGLCAVCLLVIWMAT